MDEKKVWRLPATLFIVGMLAMLLAGAWRDLDAKAQAAATVSLPAVEQQEMGEPPSNEVSDWNQLD